MASNIKNQLFSGVFYTALAKYSGIVISLVIAGILARLLSPDDFGIVAVATVIIAFFNGYPSLVSTFVPSGPQRCREADRFI